MLLRGAVQRVYNADACCVHFCTRALLSYYYGGSSFGYTVQWLSHLKAPTGVKVPLRKRVPPTHPTYCSEV